ncbi:hypothetical protein AMECASPLE_026862 [Ameca splendens]|uniref:Uncharacterized protein n=1 Tax=Ameca splendens TaxID=208324 RepID=A0ABV0ZE01_9TELE
MFMLHYTYKENALSPHSLAFSSHDATFPSLNLTMPGLICQFYPFGKRSSFCASKCSLFNGGIKAHPLTHTHHTILLMPGGIHVMLQNQKSTLSLLPREYT